jgi:hypothetical protein
MRTDFLANATEFTLRHRVMLVFLLVYVVLSSFVMLHFLSSSRLGDAFGRTRYDAMLEGKAWKPFAYRVLIPRATNMITAATPEALRDWVHFSAETALAGSDTVRVYLPWLAEIYRGPTTYPRIVTTLLIYACLWGYIWALFRLAHALFPRQPAVHWFAPVFGLLVIPSFSWQWLYIYDIPLLFFATACFYAMATRNLLLYLVFFLLACLNKETTIFILMFFALWFAGRMPKTQFALLLLAQFAIYLSIRLATVYIFKDNIGFHLENNVVQVLSRDLFAKSKFFMILSVSFFFFLLTFRWMDKPLFLKYGFFLLPPFFVAYVLHGWPGEYRVFFDVMPLLILLGVHTLIVGTGIADSPFFKPAASARASQP